MSEMILNILGYGLIALSGIIIAMMMAPLEALGWWAGWYGNDFEAAQEKRAVYPLLIAPDEHNPKRHYLVFLDGIAKASKDNYDDVQMLLKRLGRELPDAAILGDVLPYSVTDRPLTRARPLSRFWQYARERKLQNALDPIGFMINLHNLFQVGVSADRRYGPIYNLGEAKLIIEDLLRRGYQPGSGVPITLIGYSGGGQIALGVTPHLKNALRAPVDVISLGGVMSADPGLSEVRFLYHLAGSKDYVERLGVICFPGRWPLWLGSSWNRAKRRGKLTFVPMGAIGHTGEHSYLDDSKNLPSGQSFVDHTVKTITRIVNQPAEVRREFGRKVKRARSA